MKFRSKLKTGLDITKSSSRSVPIKVLLVISIAILFVDNVDAQKKPKKQAPIEKRNPFRHRPNPRTKRITIIPGMYCLTQQIIQQIKMP